LADFQAVPDHRAISNAVLISEAAPPLEIDLAECVYLSCRHSPTARLLEAQRQELHCCAEPTHEDRALCHVLCALRRQQQTRSAADASEVFLRLVEMELQRQLVDESRARLAEYDRALDLVEETGFATADARHEIESQRFELKQRESELNVGEQKLLLRLNALIGISPPQRLRPIFPLMPEYIPFDVEEEIAIAICNRPEVKVLRQFATKGGGDNLSLDTLAYFDPRALRGQARPAGPFGSLTVCPTSCDNTANRERSRQIQQLLEARQQQLRLQVSERILDIQADFQTIALANAKLDELTRRATQMEGKSELDGLEAYIEAAKNWGAMQKVKSERLVAAIEFEVGKIRLLELQGCLLDCCGSCYD
jgi:hypothetical protein